MGEGPQGRGEISGLLRRHGLRPRHSLGQHFLVDPNIVRKIVQVAGVSPGSRVLEIGAGTGTLTRGLADAGADVLAYEVDDRLRPLLAEVIGDRAGVEIRFADAMAELPDALGAGDWTMVSNLPYNIGTPLLLKLLRQAAQIKRFVVMVQHEVAGRLTADPGTRLYGLPTITLSLYGEVDMAFGVPRRVFLPAPAVESTVLVIDRKAAPPPDAERAIRLASAAFGQRRKMVRRSLGRVLADPVPMLESAGLDPRARPETLTPDDWLRLAKAAPDGS